ncbi:MAG: DinB family protein [Helicobacteraceae bacterium]|jgi:uncharacterized damage-inducible protein DinB|nr:DinB family protein [Helicobacteraceae bacterium]
MFAKTILLALAKQNQAANAAVVDILDRKFSLPDRQKERGSYYHSLEGLAKHIAGGTLHFLQIAEATLKGDKTAEHILSALKTAAFFDEKPLDINGWQNLKKTITKVDRIWVELAQSLNDSNYDAIVKIDWFGDKKVSLGSFLTMLGVHNVHHRGQLSQIFDSLKIDNDYSRFDPSFFA